MVAPERNSELIRVGASLLKLDGNDYGYTIGETTIVITDDIVFAEPDQTPGPIEAFITRTTAKVSGQFAQSAEPDTFLAVLSPGSTVAGSKVSGGITPGNRVSATTYVLTLHPEDQSGTVQDFTIYKAISEGSITFAYSKEGVNVFDFSFTSLVDMTRTDNDRVWSFGNSADSTPPGRTSTVPADSAAAQAIGVVIVIVFDEAMAPRTLVDGSGHATSVTLFDATNEVVKACAAVISTTTATNDTLTLTPDANLEAAAQHYVLINEGAKDVAGNAHAGTQSDFTTAA